MIAVLSYPAPHPRFCILDQLVHRDFQFIREYLKRIGEVATRIYMAQVPECNGSCFDIQSHFARLLILVIDNVFFPVIKRNYLLKKLMTNVKACMK